MKITTYLLTNLQTQEQETFTDLDLAIDSLASKPEIHLKEKIRPMLELIGMDAVGKVFSVKGKYSLAVVNITNVE